MTTPRNTQSRLRETLKQEDSSLSERLPAVVAPPAIEAKAPPAKAAPKAPAVAPRKAAAPKAVQKPASKPVAGRTVAAAVAEPTVPTVVSGSRKPSGAAKADADKRGKAAKEKPVKPEKVARDSFSMPAGEHKRIKALRDALARAGCVASKSEVLRAGLALLAARDLSEVVRVVGALPKVPKGKRGKKA